MEKFKNYRIRKPKPSEKDIDDEEKGVPDKDGLIHVDEIPDPQFDMKYYEYDEKIVKKIEMKVRNSFEYKGLFQFIKIYLNVDHCSYYEGYSMQNGLTIELHHSPFTLYDITEAVLAKSIHDKGYYETYRIVEEVNMLHYSYKIGLTPLNPTLHKLVHSGVVPIHPAIVLGNWWEFYTEYQAFLNPSAVKKYEDFLSLKDKKNPSIPQILNFSPTKIVSPIKIPSFNEIQKLLVDSKLKKLENFIA